MAELELNRDTIRFIIDTAHELDVPDKPDDVESFGTDPYYVELKTTIEDLEPDQQMSLVALMWVGRGDYSLDEWGEALKYAEENWTEYTANYLMTTPLLADYLTEGMEIFDQEEAA